MFLAWSKESIKTSCMIIGKTNKKILAIVFKLHKKSHPTTTPSTPQGCVLSLLLFSHYTNDCTSKDPSVKLLKFADDTHSHWSHPGRRRVCLQTKGWAAGYLVQSQQPGAQHAQNCGDDSGLQEKSFTLLLLSRFCALL